MKNESFFDEIATDEYISRNSKKYRSGGLKKINRLQGDKSKDFYLGMLAATKFYASLGDKDPQDSDKIDVHAILSISLILLIDEKIIIS